MKSNFLTLGFKDFIKGLAMVFITALITGVYQLLQAGPFAFDWVTFKPIVLASIGSALAYLIKNLFTNSEDEILKPDPK